MSQQVRRETSMSTDNTAVGVSTPQSNVLSSTDDIEAAANGRSLKTKEEKTEDPKQIIQITERVSDRDTKQTECDGGVGASKALKTIMGTDRSDSGSQTLIADNRKKEKAKLGEILKRNRGPLTKELIVENDKTLPASSFSFPVLKRPTASPFSSSASSAQAVSSSPDTFQLTGFTSGKGSSISVTKAAAEMSRTLCLEEDDEAQRKRNQMAPTLKRQAPDVSTGARNQRAFKTPRISADKATPICQTSKETAENKDADQTHTLSNFVKKTPDPGGRISVLSDDSYRDEKKRWVGKETLRRRHSISRRSLQSLTNNEGRRQSWLRTSNAWRPSLSSDNDSDLDGSLRTINAENFDASNAISPEKCAEYVFPNGANLLTMYGALLDARLPVTMAWVKQQYRWVIWYLSSHTSDTYNPVTPDHTFMELKHRLLLKQSNKDLPSVLKGLTETPSTAMSVVLIVAEIVLTEEAFVKLELSDGWTSVIAEVDIALQNKVSQNEIRTGTLLYIDRLRILKAEDKSVTTRLTHNACLPVPGTTPVGEASERVFHMSLGSVVPTGGPVSSLVVCIARQYPVRYRHSKVDGTPFLLTGSQHAQRVQDFKAEMAQIQAKAKAIVHEAETKYYAAVLKKGKNDEEVDRVEILFARHLLANLDLSSLTKLEEQALNTFREKHDVCLVECIQRQEEQFKIDWGMVEPLSAVYRPLLISEVVAKSDEHQPVYARLDVWLKEAETELEFREGDVYEIRDAILTEMQSEDDLRIFETGPNTSFHKVVITEKPWSQFSIHFTPRRPISDLRHLLPGKDFDFDGFVISCGQSTGILLCLDAHVTRVDASTLLLAITTDDCLPLSDITLHQLWRFKDLQYLSITEHNSVTARLTSKSHCLQLTDPETLKTVNSCYTAKKSSIQKRIVESMPTL